LAENFSFESKKIISPIIQKSELYPLQSGLESIETEGPDCFFNGGMLLEFGLVF